MGVEAKPSSVSSDRPGSDGGSGISDGGNGILVKKLERPLSPPCREMSYWEFFGGGKLNPEIE